MAAKTYEELRKELIGSQEQAKWLSQQLGDRTDALTEARRQIERERQDHIETLTKASAFIVEQDRALGRLRAVVNAMSDDVGSAVIRGREHLARIVASGVRGDFPRPMSHANKGVCEHGYPSDGSPRTCGIDHESPKQAEPPSVEAEEDLERHAERYDR